MAQQYIGMTLPIRRGNNGMFQQSLSAYEQARSNFKNLILTKKGERIHQPELGCDIWKLLFEPMTDDITEQVRLSIVEAVDRWLPYLEVQNMEVQSSPDTNRIDIKCTYRFRNNPNVGDTVSISANTDTGTINGAVNG
jgi:phage baseplate assembly protein W